MNSLYDMKADNPEKPLRVKASTFNSPLNLQNAGGSSVFLHRFIPCSAIFSNPHRFLFFNGVGERSIPEVIKL